MLKFAKMFSNSTSKTIILKQKNKKKSLPLTFCLSDKLVQIAFSI